jgi:hypothetical protein
MAGPKPAVLPITPPGNMPVQPIESSGWQAFRKNFTLCRAEFME